jgi:hypothetical protein
LEVTAENQGSRPVLLDACVLLTPLGLRIYADPSTFSSGQRGVAPQDSCIEDFVCATLAKDLKGMGFSGRMNLVAVCYEAGVPPWPNAEQRSDPFRFDVDRWLVG